MSFTIREATPVDAAEVYRLIVALAEYEKLADEVKATEADIRAAMTADDPRIHVLLAETSAGSAVAIALHFFTFSTFEAAPTLYLEDLFVDPEHRGKGIGTALLRELADRASARGCRRMEWVALDWNTDARAFYENLGARPMNGWIIHRMEAKGIERMAGESADE